MKRTKKIPTIPSYFDATKEIFKIQRNILTGILPHLAERGRNDEQRFINFLKQILPQRFGIGSGFIVSSNTQAETSNQTDIIISDEFSNSPLHRELSALVYPIETVFATIEVKGTLSKYKRSNQKTDLDQVLENITKIRQLSKYKRYIEYRSAPKKKQKPNQLVVRKHPFSINLPPRGYLFAYHSDDWGSIEDFTSSLQLALQNYQKAHIHGVVILNKDWFVMQKAFTGKSKELFAYDNNCLLRFVNSLLDGIQSMPMFMTDFENYFSQLNNSVIDTEDSGFSGMT